MTLGPGARRNAAGPVGLAVAFGKVAIPNANEKGQLEDGDLSLKLFRTSRLLRFNLRWFEE